MHRKRLFDLGFQPHFKGFEYLNEILEVYRKGDSFMDIYQELAEKYGTKIKTIEITIKRCIKSNPKYEKMRVSEFVSHYTFLYDENGKERN